MRKGDGCEKIGEKIKIADELTALRSENKNLRERLSRLEEDHIFDLARQRSTFKAEKLEMLKIIKRLTDDLEAAVSNGERWRLAAEALSARVDELAFKRREYRR